MVASLANVSAEFAAELARELGMEKTPRALPKALKDAPKPEVESSAALSLFALPGDGSIKTRRVAILVAEGVADIAQDMHARLTELGAVPRFVGARLGTLRTADGNALEVEVSLETTPSVLYDAAVVPGGRVAVDQLAHVGHALEFLKDQYRHCKPILAVGKAADLMEGAGIPAALPSGEPDPGVILVPDPERTDPLPQFVEAIAKHRHFAREMDPPPV